MSESFEKALRVLEKCAVYNDATLSSGVYTESGTATQRNATQDSARRRAATCVVHACYKRRSIC